MLRRKTFVWPVVAAAMWTGCAIGPLGSYRAVSPVKAPVDYEGLVRLSARDGERTAPQSLTNGEIETIWGKLAAENPGLADQAAGEEIVIRHVYGEKVYGEMTPSGKVYALILVGVVLWGLAEIMSTE